MRYPTWLKRLVLPFEFEDHPLNADRCKREEEEWLREVTYSLTGEEEDDYQGVP